MDYFQAKTKDLPSESHSVQNISSDPIGQNTSQVKQNCCSKVFWSLISLKDSRNSSEVLWSLAIFQISYFCRRCSGISRLQKKMFTWEILSNNKSTFPWEFKWLKLILVRKVFTDWRLKSVTNLVPPMSSKYCRWPLLPHTLDSSFTINAPNILFGFLVYLFSDISNHF